MAKANAGQKRQAAAKKMGSCCGPNDILCLSIPGKANLVLLGLPLQLQVKCLRITSKKKLTKAEIKRIENLLKSLLSGLLG